MSVLNGLKVILRDGARHATERVFAKTRKVVAKDLTRILTFAALTPESLLGTGVSSRETCFFCEARPEATERRRGKEAIQIGSY